MRLTPNVKKLMLLKLSGDAVPSGGGVADALRFLSSAQSIKNGVKAAMEWTELAIDLVRKAAEPNPWKNADDEAIAAELVRRHGERKAGK